MSIRKSEPVRHVLLTKTTRAPSPDVPFSETITLSKIKGLIIRSDVRATFTGGGLRKLFHITDESDVTFVGIDFKDGKATASQSTGPGKGGAISVDDSKVTISSATFTGNEAEKRCPTEKYQVGMSTGCKNAWGQCYKHNQCAHDGWEYGLGGALYLANKAMVVLSAVQFESNFEYIATSIIGGVGSDIWIADSDSTLVCTAGCTARGMYMPDGVCTTPSPAASVHGDMRSPLLNGGGGLRSVR